MKYSELILPSVPLETVKQIRESDTFEAARRDVETFVISAYDAAPREAHSHTWRVRYPGSSERSSATRVRSIPTRSPRGVVLSAA